MTLEPLPAARCHGRAVPASGPGVRPSLLLDGEEVTAARPWPPGALLEIGPHVLALALPEQPDAHLSPAGDGGLAYNRPPRLWPASRPRRIEVPAEPKRGEKARLQLLAALLPLVLGLAMVEALHSAMYALFMLDEPGHDRRPVDQRPAARPGARTSAPCASTSRSWPRLEPTMAAAQAADEAERRIASPDPAQVLLTATGPGGGCGSAARTTRTPCTCGSG